MDASTAARVFHDWAYGEGLIPDGPFSPVTSVPGELALVGPVTDVGKQILRTKQVQAIAFNEARAEIIVFTRRVAPGSKKQLGAVPNEVDGVKVKYRQGVQTAVGAVPSMPFGGPPYVVRAAMGSSRYACGSSISVGNCREAGTMGALVRDANGTMYGLSNNHVSASCSFAAAGLPILAPGVLDVAAGGLSPFTLGFHAAALPLVPGSVDNVDPKANLDAATFRIADDAIVTSFQGDAYDTPAVVGPLAPDLKVEKVGRTTGHTTGRVVGQIHGAHAIQYSAALYGFSGVIFFDPVYAIVGNGQAFSDNGDSGSLITSIDENSLRTAVGIVVGGMQDGSAPGGKITIALPIQPILAALGVTLVSGHNV